jgi:hypothetical protein
MQHTSLSPLSNSPFNFHHFSKKNLKNTLCYKSPPPPHFLGKNSSKGEKKFKKITQKITTIAYYNMEGC